MKMGEKSYQAWTISDGLWEAVKGGTPNNEREPARGYEKRSELRTEINLARKSPEGIFYVLRAGCQWETLY